MVYKKRYYKKKRYYSKKRTLKKSTIFGKKSAKSQAKQIYALNKKVNAIQKYTKPEIQTLYVSEDSGLMQESFSPSADNTHYRGHVSHFMLFRNLMAGSNPVWNFNGNLVRIQKRIKLMIKFAAHAGGLLDGKLIYRIVIMRMNGPQDNNSFSGLFNTGIYEDDEDDIRSVIYGPLATDITTQGKIIYNKIGSFSDKEKEPVFTKYINLYGGVYRRNADITQDVGRYGLYLKGDYLIGIAYGWTSQNIDADASHVLSRDKITVSIGCKFGYIDDNDTTPSENRRKIIKKADIDEMKRKNKENNTEK